MYQVWLFSINMQGYIDNFISKKKISYTYIDYVYQRPLKYIFPSVLETKPRAHKSCTKLHPQLYFPDP